jgi:hypothetical protein
MRFVRGKEAAAALMQRRLQQVGEEAPVTVQKLIAFEFLAGGFGGERSLLGQEKYWEE